MKSVWKGNLSVGLVNIPVKAYSAYKIAEGISFHLLCGKCHSRLKYKRWCPKCEREVPWDEVVKGYKVKKGKWVTFKKEELRNIPLESSKNLRIEKFIDLAQVDSLYFDKSYYLVPEEGVEQAYHLFRDVLHINNKAAVARVTLRQKEYVVVIRPYQRGLLMITLYYPNEIRRPEEFSELQKEVEIEEEQEKLATKLLENLTGEFDINQYQNRYEQAVKQMIEQKLEGKKVVTPKIPKPTKVKEIIASLKASVEATKEKKEELKPKKKIKIKA